MKYIIIIATSILLTTLTVLAIDTKVSVKPNVCNICIAECRSVCNK